MQKTATPHSPRARGCNIIRLFWREGEKCFFFFFSLDNPADDESYLARLGTQLLLCCMGTQAGGPLSLQP